MPELISIIVATYNSAEALDAVLGSLSRQGDRGFEVLVADDGSGPATAAVVECWKSRTNVVIGHVWHEHRGFRAGLIRNRAILASRGDYCIFLDGDCLARPDFVATHRRLAQPGWFVAGNRILLSPEFTMQILRERFEPESWGRATWVSVRARGHINRIAPMLKLPLGPLRKINAKRWEGARGANLAVRKSDLIRVDGFDAQYDGWGLEDSDIIVRLIRSGVRRKDGRFATGVLHLWHPEADRSHLGANRARLEALLKSDRVRAVVGLSKLAQESPATDIRRSGS